MTEFSPNLVMFGDDVGLGRWLVGHYRQHLVYQQTLATRSPPVLIADHPLMRIGETDDERKEWLSDHSIVHEQLRGYTGVNGGDLSQVDLKNERSFQLWIDAHASEHVALDKAFGLP